MHGVWYYSVLSIFFFNVHGLTLQNDATVIPPSLDTWLPSLEDECDPTAIPVMDSFDMKKFSGAWFELSKSASGYIDANDGMWRIQTNNSSSIFLFSGRDSNAHCIRPIKGEIRVSDQPPGTLTLSYKTYSNHVQETIRVLFTDYTSIAVIYKCVHHIHRPKEVCHSAGVMGAIWTREPHVQLHVYESAIRYLEMACVHRSVLVIRNLVGPCKVDDVGFHIDDFPVPDFCYQPKDLGSCNANLRRYYYNPQSKKCEPFIYNGCGGNRNNFMSFPECQEKCVSVSSKEPICMVIAECGIHCAPCCSEDRTGCVECTCKDVDEAPYVKCTKNPESCEPECLVEEYFMGCYFCNCDSDEEKEPIINTKIDPPACLEMKREGDCKEQIERFYYNAVTGECEAFMYSGCNGNKNNFETMDHCYEKCIGNILKADVLDENSSTINKYNTRTIVFLLLIFITFSHTRS